ncbi:ROK family protein [Streptomyces sp. NBC_00873]|uniref:ROK family protein n=1 Tax=Streptomyces sp. NBC_00873 TaxID=2975852 RepID=UPI003866E9C4
MWSISRGDVGIGEGLIVQGRPLVGSRGYGGEVGHVTVHPDGPLCGCGRRGCWEAFVGLNALQGYFRSDTDGSPASAAQAVDSSTGVGAVARADQSLGTVRPTEACSSVGGCCRRCAWSSGGCGAGLDDH